MKITREYKRNLEQDNWFYVHVRKEIKTSKISKGIMNLLVKVFSVTQTAVAKAAKYYITNKYKNMKKVLTEYH